MKHLSIYRGKSKDPFTCTNGDVYDSSGVLVEDDTAIDTRIAWTSEHINTDFTEHYKGGILQEGTYYGIVGFRSTGKRVIKLFAMEVEGKPLGIKKIKDDSFIPWKAYILPSIVSNPNQNGRFEMEAVELHDGGITWDFSHGCLTVLNDPAHKEFDLLKMLLRDNEIIKISVIHN